MEEISESLGENIENCFNDIINIANLSISTRDANEINEKRLSKIENLKLGARVCNFLEGIGVKLVFTGGAASIITIGVNAYMDKPLVQNLMLSACVVAFGSAMSYMSSKLQLKKEEKILLLENKKEIVAGFIENVSAKNLDEDIRRVKMKYIDL